MLPNRVEWYFPSTLKQAAKLIERPGVILHAGGTRILKTQTGSIKGLVDVEGLKLNSIVEKKKEFHIGSACTFSDLIEFSRDGGGLEILANSLSTAASTPLRNRITIGGSMKDFPLWSSLYAPLIALDAKVVIYRNKEITFPVEDYVASGEIKTKHIIKKIIVPKTGHIKWRVKRFSLIKFEYPLFNIAVLLKMNNSKINEARLVITGVKNRYKRFKRAENMLAGKELSHELMEKVTGNINPQFLSDYKYSAGYKAKVAKVYFSDLLHSIAEDKR